MVLKGSMTMAQRDVMIRSFSEDPEVTVFLMSLKAGGVPPHPMCKVRRGCSWYLCFLF